ncbi:uncharacterized protein STEHIDRAFT_161123 [Stereum hirsutum FP-91666 SS1]|uniref:uncharacterized protein n=1 Tax=Stereum hirsutum (strain FP-91666) TaxID=721885 RepID=UPI000444A63A|nr:uncharacterized protein STEHIDRAFT_161123 [Stereum hirsutum FP-91666 SS1]EIM82595.1 hypothetical protein STEHIDRAFT_161123 [Stereum hirsutum FP-91666 SS1]
MGASQSKSDDGSHVFHSETPIQDLVNHLSDQSSAPGTSAPRQETIDGLIRQRIEVEIERLREEEKQVRDEIERELEKENLDRERSMAGDASSPEHAEDESTVGDIKSSAVLMGDLEEVRSKVERFQHRRELTELPTLKAKGEAVVECYRSNPTTSLNCWREVAEFKSAVSQVEQDYVTSLR